MNLDDWTPEAGQSIVAALVRTERVPLALEMLEAVVAAPVDWSRAHGGKED